MKVKSIRLQNFRSFVDSGEIELKQINILIGANNSGKSSVLRGLNLFQQGSDNLADVRAGSTTAEIDIQIKDTSSFPQWNIPNDADSSFFRVKISASPDRLSGNMELVTESDGQRRNSGDLRLQNAEPHHFIVPFLSKRKIVNYSEDVRASSVFAISSEMTNLAAKLSRLSNPEFPGFIEYTGACRAILGFVVTAIPSGGGQRPGVYLIDRSSVPIDQMGEGVPNIVALLCSLVMSRGKLFLIEELENDLHPSALKALLDLIVKSSEHNQFVISTHSNIVVTHLCADANSQLFQVTAEKSVLPTSAQIALVSPTPDARIKVLQELGYSFSDFDLWDGWLFLEESSAERLIRDYLIPWFAPKLKRLRTIAAQGVTDVEPKFADFNRLMLFTHLEPAYVGKSWVRVDGDETGKAVVAELHQKFPTIPSSAISHWKCGQFEYYYPSLFSERANEALAILDKQCKRQAKKTLLHEVMEWLNEDESRARIALRESASEVIDDLVSIERELFGSARIVNGIQS